MFPEVTHVKKKDLVQVMAGKDKGKTGKVLRILNKKHRVVVEKINLVKRHSKPTQKGPGGIVEKEGAIAASKVLLFCEKCGRGVRTQQMAADGGKKLRQCSRCETVLDK